ncbi:MAG: hypothetical protein ACXVQ6_02060 [Actinomycetota bacterium]
MADEESKLVPFEPQPDLVPHTNGSHLKRRRRIFGGLIFGVLLGSLLATSLVSRLQWLNLASIGWWGPPVAAAVGAGLLVGAFRRDDVRSVAVAGAAAGLISLWSVYALVRLGVHVLFVERSVARVVAADLLRLAAYGVPGGAVGAAASWGARTGFDVLGARRTAR